MLRLNAPLLLGAAVMAAVWLISQSASAQGWSGYSTSAAPPRPVYPGTTSYWTPGDAYGNWRASLYPSPVQVPAYVGQVYYTYPPLYPHNYLSGHYTMYFQSPTKGLFKGLFTTKCGPRPNWTEVHVHYSAW